MYIVSQADETDVISSVMVRLEGLHLLLSYAGEMGKLMIGSSIEEIWKQIYAKNSVVHMVNGLAYARALRAHSLLQTAHIILEQCLEYQSLTNSDVQILP